jgi:hypothetical protein
METNQIEISTLCDGCGILVPMAVSLADWERWQCLAFESCTCRKAKAYFPYLSEEECRILVEFRCTECTIKV